MAHPAVGLAAAAHPELDDPAARVTPTAATTRTATSARGRSRRCSPDYAEASAAPVLTGTTVTSVRPAGGGYVVRTDQGSWHARDGGAGRRGGDARRACRRWRGGCPPGSPRSPRRDYRNPGELPDGGVLVVGASASGIQLAEELHRSGRPVTLAVGEHVRMPRTYRGRDILWWLDAAGMLDERYDEVDDLVRARNLPSHAAGRLAGPARST